MRLPAGVAASGGEGGVEGVPERTRAVSASLILCIGWPFRFSRRALLETGCGLELRGLNGFGLSGLRLELVPRESVGAPRGERVLRLVLQTQCRGCVGGVCGVAEHTGLLVGQSCDGGYGRLGSAIGANEKDWLFADLLLALEFEAPAHGAWAPGSATAPGADVFATGCCVQCECLPLGPMCTGEAICGLLGHSHCAALFAVGSGDETSPEDARLPPTPVTLRAPVLSAEGCKRVLAAEVLSRPQALQSVLRQYSASVGVSTSCRCSADASRTGAPAGAGAG